MAEKSDLEKFVELYNNLGIKLKPEVCQDGKLLLELSSKVDSDKFGGYSGFCSEILFDKDGKFLTQDFYE